MSGLVKRTILRNQPRQVVVDGMAKKLAVRGEASVVVARKKKLGWAAIWISCGLVLAVGATFSIIRLRSERASSALSVSGAKISNPVLKLLEASEQGSISNDELARYLGFILFRYDSLPDRFRVERPLVRDTDVYRALAPIWETLSLATRQNLLSEVPDLLDKLRNGQDDSDAMQN